MKLSIDASGMTFIAAGPPEAVVDFETKVAKLDESGKPMFGLQVVALIDGGAEVLDHLRAEMDTRYAELLAWQRRKVAPEDGLGLHVVVIDELALYLAAGDKKTRDRLAESPRDLIARGRAAGVIVLAATQRPSSDIVPTSIRDLFGFRRALRCPTRDASDTILGAGWATEGCSAADIDPACRGVGYLLHEGGVPTRLRASYLDDTTLNTLAARAATIRGYQP